MTPSTVPRGSAAADRTTPAPKRSRLTGAAAIASTALLIHALVWLLFPTLNPYGDSTLSLLRPVIGLPVFTGLLGTIGLIGAVVAGVASLRPRIAGTTTMVRVTSPVLSVVLIAATASTHALALAGYLVALLLPIVAAVVGVVAAVRSQHARPWVVLALIAGTVAGVVFHVQVWAAVTHVAPALLGKLDQSWAAILTLSVLALWTVVAGQALRGSAPVHRITARLVRHRVAVTVMAAVGPLPYALARLSWFTPWPIGSSEALGPEMIAWGIILSLGAWMGAILTLGLIRPWGEVFPRWMPRVGGAPVPPAVAIVPGAVVAGLITLAAIPMLIGISSVSAQMWPYVLLLPLWYWGPMLALAVWAYGGHRATMVR